MAATHTPGPWEFVQGPKNDPDFEDCEFLIAESRDRGEVVGTVTGPIHRGTPEGNARLMAAAPDLCETLSNAPVLSRFHGVRWFDVEAFIDAYSDWMDRRRAALARVE